MLGAKPKYLILIGVAWGGRAVPFSDRSASVLAPILILSPKLDISTARRRLKSPRSLSGTFAHLTMVTQVNIMVLNGRLTSFLFIINRSPHSWDKAFQTLTLKTPSSRSCVWSKGKVIQSSQYHINSLPFHFTSIRPTIPEIELFRNLTLKHPRSRSWVRSKVKVIYCTSQNNCALTGLCSWLGGRGCERQRA